MPEPRILIWGVDHHRTPVAIRERLASEGQQGLELARQLLQLPGIGEAVVVSTCNRLECYLAGEIADEELGAAISEVCGVDPALISRHSYLHRGAAAVRHLFRVAAGLESMVVGEEQIIHQLRDAYDAARQANLAGASLHPLFQRSLALAKEVRTATGIGRHKLSVASVAVDLARQIHGDLSGARLLLIGAGTIAELTVRYLREQGVRQLGIINRSSGRAATLKGDSQARVWPWEQLVPALAEHDIVVSSTAAPHPVVSCDDLRQARRRGHHPILLIDLAVPRDIDPAAAQLADIYLYNIDHLESVVAGNLQQRLGEVAGAEAVVESSCAAFLHQADSGQQLLLAQLAGYFRDTIAAEEARLAGKLGLSEDQRRRADLRYGLERVANKLQHRLLAYVRAHPGDARAEEFLRQLLEIEASPPQGEAGERPPDAQGA